MANAATVVDLDQRRRRRAEYALAVGSRVGPYTIQRVIAEGGYGDVYEAKHRVLGRHVALKILQDRHADRDDLQRRLAQEARVFSEIKSPYMVTVYDAGTLDGRVWMAMELVPGRTLREELVVSEPLPVLRALNTAACIASGVGEAHALRVVHRDLKPENVMVTPDGHIVVLDLGTAKILSDKRGKDTQRVMGTPAYMSVEHLLGPKDGLPIDQRTDVYAVAVMLYEMLSGFHPFAFDRTRGVLLPPPHVIRRVVEAPVEPLCEVAPQVPDYVARIVEKGLSRDRELRQTTMQELETELRLAARWFVEDRALAERRNEAAGRGNPVAGAERGSTLAHRPVRAAPAGSDTHEDDDDTDPDMMCRPLEDATLEERGAHAVTADPARVFARSESAGSARMATERLPDPDPPMQQASTAAQVSTRTAPALRDNSAAAPGALRPPKSGLADRAIRALALVGTMFGGALDWLKTNFVTLRGLIASRQVPRSMIVAPAAGALVGLLGAVLLNLVLKPTTHAEAESATQSAKQAASASPEPAKAAKQQAPSTSSPAIVARPAAPQAAVFSAKTNRQRSQAAGGAPHAPQGGKNHPPGS